MACWTRSSTYPDDCCHVLNLQVINRSCPLVALLVLQAQPYGNTPTQLHALAAGRTGPAQHIVTGLQMS
jgi:hypothetical protein